MVLSHMLYNGLDQVNFIITLLEFSIECIFRIDIHYVIQYLSQIGCMSSARLLLLLLGANQACSPYSAQFSCKSLAIIQIVSLVMFPDNYVYSVVVNKMHFIACRTKRFEPIFSTYKL
jgi:hypothetical protein